jgi:hypothetical protein
MAIREVFLDRRAWKLIRKYLLVLRIEDRLIFVTKPLTDYGTLAFDKDALQDNGLIFAVILGLI